MVRVKKESTLYLFGVEVRRGKKGISFAPAYLYPKKILFFITSKRYGKNSKKGMVKGYSKAEYR